jgi:hypothetical protein
MIFVPLLDVIWKKEWPNHVISTNPEETAGTMKGAFPSPDHEATAGTRKGGSPFTRFGFLQAASTCPEKTKRQAKDIVSSTKNLEFFLISTSHIANNEY